MNIKALAFTKPANNIKNDVVGIAGDVQSLVNPAEKAMGLAPP